MHELGIVFHIIDSLKEVGEENHLKQIAVGVRQNRASKGSITYCGTNSGSDLLRGL